MKAYAVEVLRTAAGELEHLPVTVVPRVVRAMRGLEQEPRPRGCRKLRGSMATYRIRVGDYRVVYEIDDRARNVVITRVRHRKEAYS